MPACADTVPRSLAARPCRSLAAPGYCSVIRTEQLRAMRYGLLGSLDVRTDDDVRVDIPAAKRRALLAILLLQRGRPARREDLIERLWGPDATPGRRGVALRPRLAPPRRARGRCDPHRRRRLSAAARRRTPSTSPTFEDRVASRWAGGHREPLGRCVTRAPGRPGRCGAARPSSTLPTSRSPSPRSNASNELRVTALEGWLRGRARPRPAPRHRRRDRRAARHGAAPGAAVGPADGRAVSRRPAGGCPRGVPPPQAIPARRARDRSQRRAPGPRTAGSSARIRRWGARRGPAVREAVLLPGRRRPSSVVGPELDAVPGRAPRRYDW